MSLLLLLLLLALLNLLQHLLRRARTLRRLNWLIVHLRTERFRLWFGFRLFGSVFFAILIRLIRVRRTITLAP